jgi:hypothetical protein
MELENKEKEAFVFPKTLNEIKERYGRVDQIVLYSGKIIDGVILIRKENEWKVLVPGKYITINAKDVQTTKKIM